MKLVYLLPFLLCASSAIAQLDRGAPLPRKGTLGAQFSVLSEAERKDLGIGKGGMRVGNVFVKGTADVAGLRSGDILMKVAGKPILAVQDIIAFVRKSNSGDIIKLEVIRDKKPVALSGKLVARPKQTGDGSFEVEYDQVVSKGKRIRVIFTHPKGNGPYPTVFLIGGIGAYSIDSEFAAMPYGNILSAVANANYATVRMDKPGQGDSEGPTYSDLLFDDELDAYIQTLKLAKTKSFVDKNRIAIFGHSMGGAFGPLVAATEPVKAICAAATMTKTWVEYCIENTRRQMFLNGAGQAAQMTQEMDEFTRVFHYLFNEKLMPKEIAKKHPELKNAVNAISADGKTYSGVGLLFFQQLSSKNLMDAWSKSDAHVLAMYGECDFITCREDHEFLAQAINTRKQGKAEFKLIPRTDHGFFEVNSQRESAQKWGQPGTPINHEAEKVLLEWLRRVL